MEIDNKTVTYDGMTVRLSAEADPDTRPEEFDCYSPEDIVAWRNDAWCFVTVIATVEDDEGTVIGESAVSGVEHGTLAGVEVDALDLRNGSAAEGTCAEAVTQAQAELDTRAERETAPTATVLRREDGESWIVQIDTADSSSENARGPFGLVVALNDADLYRNLPAEHGGTANLIECAYDAETEEWTVYARADASEDFSRFEGSPLADLLSIAHDVATGG